MTPKLGRIRGVQEIKVIEVQYCAGEGIPGDPFRSVMQYWSAEGKLLATCDEWSDPEKEN